MARPETLLTRLPGMDLRELREEWFLLYQTEAGTKMSAKLLRLVIGYRIQELEYGATERCTANRRFLVEQLAGRLPRTAPPVADSPVEIRITGHGLKCGMHLKVVLEVPGGLPEPDHRLVREILRAIRWFDALSSGAADTINDLAKAENCCPALISDRIRLAFLAPDIVEMIIEGRQPTSLTASRLLRACPLPVSWEEQHKLLFDRNAD